MRILLKFSIMAFFSLWLIACDYLGEGAKGLRRHSYSEVKEAINSHKPLTPEELDKLYRECPRPNGVFDNLAVGEKSGLGLSKYFSVPDFELPATSFPGGGDGDEPIPSSGSSLNILGGIKNGVRQYYNDAPSERFTLELRPLVKSGWFRIVVRSSKGLSGEAEGYLSLSGEKKRCEDGVLKAFWRNYDQTVPGWELYVEPDTGDVVMAYNSAKERGDISYRFKRIGK